MADDEAFLLPVVIDDTPDATARVSGQFRKYSGRACLAGSLQRPSTSA